MSSAATNFLSRHGASLTSDEQGGFWLNYTVPGVEFGERVIERLAVYLPLAAGNLDVALYLAEVILRDHMPPECNETHGGAPAPLKEGRHLFRDRAA